MKRSMRKAMPIAEQHAEPPKEAPAAKPRMKPLDPAGIQEARHAFRTWHLDLGKIKRVDGTPATLDDLLKPAFWVNNVELIGIDDYIEVVAADKSLAFRLIVKGVDPGIGLYLEVDSASMPGSPGHTALLRLQAAARAERDTQQAELNRQHGIVQP